MCGVTYVTNGASLDGIFELFPKMAFVQIPHSECPEKNGKDPPFCSMLMDVEQQYSTNANFNESMLPLWPSYFSTSYNTHGEKRKISPDENKFTKTKSIRVIDSTNLYSCDSSFNENEHLKLTCHPIVPNTAGNTSENPLETSVTNSNMDDSTYFLSEDLLTLQTLADLKNENSLEMNSSENDVNISKLLFEEENSYFTDNNLLNNGYGLDLTQDCNNSNEFSYAIEGYSVHNSYPRGSTDTSSAQSVSSPEEQVSSCTMLDTPNPLKLQYTLLATTSSAMKINEETLTYLNQGQPYEIKFNVLDYANVCDKVFKSTVRMTFHDRRLRHAEEEQIAAWKSSHSPADRLLEIDIHQSYGIFEVGHDENCINSFHFTWKAEKEIAIYIKVNCVSTEFTAKKRGGEKGISFRIQIETTSLDKPYNLHIGSCQIKVFKLKGAERKHKQDQEKLSRKPLCERGNYQRSCRITKFTEVQKNGQPVSSSYFHQNSLSYTGINEKRSIADSDNKYSIVITDSDFLTLKKVTLNKDSNTYDVQQWLRMNRFSTYCNMFENFTGSDMFSLSRNDYIQICGVADGIRLYKTLIATPRLTLYVGTSMDSNIYHPIYLKALECWELIKFIAPLVGLDSSQIFSIYATGPNGARVVITNEFIQHMEDESMYIVETAEFYDQPSNLLLKQVLSAPEKNANS